MLCVGVIFSRATDRVPCLNRHDAFADERLGTRITGIKMRECGSCFFLEMLHFWQFLVSGGTRQRPTLTAALHSSISMSLSNIVSI